MSTMPVHSKKKTANINVRVDPAVKSSIEELYGAFGITVSDAVNMFFRKSLMEGGLPFDLRQPRYNAETEAAMQEARVIMKKNNTPSAVIILPEEYERLSEVEQSYQLLLEATERLEGAKGKPTISMADSMAELGITQEDLDALEDPVIE